MKYWVGLSHHNTAVSRLIAARMGKGYSHVFMLFQCNGEMIVMHATGRGVNAMSWVEFQKQNHIVKMIELPCDERSAKAFTYCVSKLGTTYGFLAIVAIGLGVHYQDGEKTLICSEYVAKALDLKFDKVDDLVTPADIEDRL